MSFTRHELIDNAYDCMACELAALPDDRARIAVYIRLAHDLIEGSDMDETAFAIAELPPKKAARR